MNESTKVHGIQAQKNIAAKKAAWAARKVEIVAQIKRDMARAAYARNLADRAVMLSA
jgi:hypothetical protein